MDEQILAVNNATHNRDYKQEEEDTVLALKKVKLDTDMTIEGPPSPPVEKFRRSSPSWGQRH
jgi:hypothetical protein